MILNGIKITLLFLPLIHFSGLYNLFSLPKIFFISLALMLLSLYIIIKNKFNISISLNNEQKIFIGNFGLFILVLTIGLLFSPDIHTSLIGSIERYYGYLGYVLIFIYLVILTIFVKNNDIMKLLKIVLISGVLVALIGIIYYNFGIHYEHRNISTIGQYNILGLYLVPSLFLSIYFYLQENNKKYILFFVIIFVSIILTKSRIAFGLSIIGLLGIYMIYFPLLNQVKKYISLVFLFIIIISSGIFFSDRLNLNEANLASIKSREILYNYGFNTIQKSGVNELLFGHSLESQKILLQSQVKPQLYLYEKVGDIPDKVHNILLDGIIEYGIVGTFLFLFITLLYPIILFYKKQNKNTLDKIVLLSILALFIGNLVGFNYFITFILNLILSLYFININSNSKKNINKKINIQVYVFVFFIISSICTYIYSKEIIINYKIKNITENPQYIGEILGSTNKYLQLELLKKNINQKTNDEIINNFHGTSNPLFLEYSLSYYLNSKKQDINILDNISEKLLIIHPFNITALLVQSEICRINNNLACQSSNIKKINELFPSQYFGNNNKKSDYFNRKVKKIKLYYGLEQLAE